MAFRRRPQRERYQSGRQQQLRQLRCPHCRHQFELGPEDDAAGTAVSGKLHCPSCGREENDLCAHGCKECETRSRWDVRCLTPDHIQCRGCGHSTQQCRGGGPWGCCQHCPKIATPCPGCDSLFVAAYKTKGTTCASCCRPLDAQCLECLPSKNDICKPCWLEWCAAKLPVTLQLIEEDGESKVTCTNLAGTELLKTEGDLSEKNIERARILLERCMDSKVMDQNISEKRLARNWQPYDESQFQEYYGDNFEREWSIAAPIPMFTLILLGVDGEELKSRRGDQPQASRLQELD